MILRMSHPNFCISTLLTLVVIPVAGAQGFNPIATPANSYTATTTVLQTNVVRPNGCSNGATNLFSSLTGGTQTINFNYPVGVMWLPECENLIWGTPPAVESAVPATSYTAWFDGFGGVTPPHSTLIVTLSPPATVFGFEGATEISGGSGTITAVYKDAQGNVLGTISKTNAGIVNNNLGAQLIAASSDTPIASVEISTQGQTLDLAQLRAGNGFVQGVEVTQAIQQYQSLNDLKSTLLNSNGSPLVPIVAGKPAVMRVYISPLPNATTLTVKLSGVSTQSITHSLPPNCSAANQRLNRDCPSYDFYFTPPAGPWSAHLDIVDSSGNLIEHHDLNFQSQTTQSVVVRPVSVCDNDFFGQWQCQEPTAMNIAGLRLIRNIAPTASLTRSVAHHSVRLDTTPYAPNHNAGDSLWFSDVTTGIRKFYLPSDAAADSAANRHTLYFGMINPNVFNGTVGGVAYAAPTGGSSHAAAGLANVTRLGNQVDFEVYAHETAHTLGVKHTNVAVASAVHQAPGCYNTAVDPTTYWPFTDNRIQSATGLEVGFDVSQHRPLDPTANFEVSSYCTPRWISPIDYTRMLAQLAAPQTAPTVATGQYWQVSGSIQNNTATLDPLFQLTTQGSADPGTGTYSIVVRDQSGNALYTRQFTPQSVETETSGPDFVAAPAFSELVPVQPNAKSIALLGPSQATLQSITLGGTAPTVTIVPFLNFLVSGFQTVAWIPMEPGVKTLTSRVQYSADGGVTWIELGQSNDLDMNVAFDDLPGSNQALIRVLASDGVNTGSATSQPFKVAKKSPDPAEIVSPANNSIWTASSPVTLSGGVFDPDDGDLSGASLVWTSNRQGTLGTGTDLSINLEPGAHKITLTGTDSDGNKVSATVNITVADQPPVVTVAVNGANMTVTAAPGTNGAPITSLMYTVNGGATWQTINSSATSFHYTASGPTDLVAEAVDAAGQWGLGEGKALQVPLSVTVTPKTLTLPIDSTQQFTATVLGSSNTAVIWAVNPNLGYIDQTGFYTASYANPVPQTVTITAYAVANTNVSGSAAVTLTAGPPSFMEAQSGDGESAVINTAFGAPLVALAIDDSGNPVPNAKVTFTAPPLTAASVTFATTGTNTATVTTNSSGIATSPAMTANGVAGNIQIAAASGSANPTAFFIISTAQ